MLFGYKIESYLMYKIIWQTLILNNSEKHSQLK